MANFLILRGDVPVGIIQIEPNISIDLETNEFTNTIEIMIRGLSIKKYIGLTFSVGSPVSKQMGMTIMGVSIPINLPSGLNIRRASDQDLKDATKP